VLSFSAIAHPRNGSSAAGVMLTGKGSRASGLCSRGADKGKKGIQIQTGEREGDLPALPTDLMRGTVTTMDHEGILSLQL
jgi:hypothetical protein